jgi:hypothetical protein
MSDSSKMLLYYANDMLDLAQILKGVFKKNTERFDLKKAVKEVL